MLGNIAIFYTTLLALNSILTSEAGKYSCEINTKVIDYEDGHEEIDFDCKLLHRVTQRGDDVVQFRKTQYFTEFKNKKKIENGDTIECDGCHLNHGELIISTESKVLIRKPEYAHRVQRISTKGSRKTLVIWIQASDFNTTTPMDDGKDGCLTDEVFGTYGDPINLHSQFKACSFDQLNFVPVNAESTTGVPVHNGVYSVKINQPVLGVDVSTVVNAVKAAATDALGNLPSQYDNVMLCIPPGTKSNGKDWHAFAYVNHWLSVFNDRKCNYVTLGMHEIGHNLNLAHAGDKTDEYGDTTGIMGYSWSFDDVPVMCFNGPNNWQLGWYSDYHATLSPKSQWSGNLYGISSYGNLSFEGANGTHINGSKMIVKIDNIYVTFNRKKGVNIGTCVGGNEVLVHSKTGDESTYEASLLLAKLGSGDQYSVYVNAKLVTINVTSINEDEDFATVFIESQSACHLMKKSKCKASNVCVWRGNLDEQICRDKFITESPSTLSTQSPSTAPISSPPTSPGKRDCDGMIVHDCKSEDYCWWKLKKTKCQLVACKSGKNSSDKCSKLVHCVWKDRTQRCKRNRKYQFAK